MLLLCKNARTYNQEGSVIYVDSQELETAFLAARAEMEGEDLGESDMEEDVSPEVWGGGGEEEGRGGGGREGGMDGWMDGWMDGGREGNGEIVLTRQMCGEGCVT